MALLFVLVLFLMTVVMLIFQNTIGIIINSIILICLIGIFIISHIESKKFKITKYNIDVFDNTSFSGFKIAMLADMHNCWFGVDSDSILNAINDYSPDIIVIAGDMIVCRNKHITNNLKTAGFINALAKIAPVYYGYGNHEMGVAEGLKDVGDNWTEYVSLFGKDIHLLDNDKFIITKDKQQFLIFGLNLPIDYYERLKVEPLDEKKISSLIGEVDEDSYNILIAHNPDYFKSYIRWGANLILSGHNHGGLVKLPILGGVISPRLHLFPKYSYGLYEKGNSKMILTNGLGAHSLKIRVNNIPEIVFIDIR